MSEIFNILRNWEVDGVVEVTALKSGRVFRVRCRSGRRLILKRVGEDSPAKRQRMEFDHEVLRHLDACEVPVAAPLADSAGRHLSERDGFLWTLSPDLSAEHCTSLSQGLDLAAQCRAFRNCGQTIARMHRALATFPADRLAGRTWTTCWPDDLIERWIPAIQSALTGDDRISFDTLLAEVLPTLQSKLPGLSMQLINRDCHGGNLVCDGERVVGFIDCDHFSIGPRLFDVAYFIAHMILPPIHGVDCREPWFGVFPSLLRGYDSVTAFSPAEREAFHPMLMGVYLMFAGASCQCGNPAAAKEQIAGLAWLWAVAARVVALR